MLKRLKLNQVGDTMVEVLISMAIVSMILGGAYVTSNKSTLSIRDAQEHVDALKLASAEIELLKSLSPPPLNGNHLCFTLDGTPHPYTTDNSECILTSAGDKDSTGILPAYTVNITDVVINSYDTFRVNISWASITGGNGNIDMYYRTN